MRIESDFLVIGSGIAGLSYALQAADHGSVAIVTKRDISESATKYAQGGIASVYSDEDSFDAHVEDTLVAGAGICHEDVVRMVVEEGPQTIRNLIEWGVKFTTSGASYDLTREGGHSARRILHAEDITGREIERALVEAVRQHPAITIYENHIAIDLITSAKIERRKLEQNRCLGAYVLDIQADTVVTFSSKITLLASGGAGKVYLYTCNPTWRPATELPWLIAPVPQSPTWNSCSFTLQPCTIPRRNHFLSPKRCAVKGQSCADETVRRSWRNITNSKTWRRVTSWPAPLTTR